MNIRKFELFNRALGKQLDNQLVCLIRKDDNGYEQARLDSLSIIRELKDMLNEELHNTSEVISEQARLIFENQVLDTSGE